MHANWNFLRSLITVETINKSSFELSFWISQHLSHYFYTSFYLHVPCCSSWFLSSVACWSWIIRLSKVTDKFTILTSVICFYFTVIPDEILQGKNKILTLWLLTKMFQHFFMCSVLWNNKNVTLYLPIVM